MAMRKYQSVEKTEILDEEDHSKLSKSLKKFGKKRVSELPEDERKEILDTLDK